MSSKHIENKIKTTVVEFIGDMMENVFEEGTPENAEIGKVKMFFDVLTAVDVAQYAVDKVLPFSTKIKNHELSFFEDNKHEIFKGLPSETIDKFAKLFTLPSKKGGLSEENIAIVWSYWDTIVELTEMMKKRH